MEDEIGDDLRRREDHNYVVRQRVQGNADIELPSRRVTRAQMQRVGNNTDHDYLATGAAGGVVDVVEAVADEAVADEDDDVELEEETHQRPEIVQQALEGQVQDEAPIVNESANDPPDPGPVLEEAQAAGTSAATATVPSNDILGAVNVVNLTSPSPPKKRKRLSNGTPKNGTPRVKNSSASGGNADEDEDDGLTCPICLDTWEMSGEHRLVSLRCGHLFGDSCIRRWLTESARQSSVKVCPQCKTKTSHKDIRCLYAKRLRAIDRSEEHHLREQLDGERRRSLELQTELATLKVTYALVTKKMVMLESENNRLQHKMHSCAHTASHVCRDADHMQRLQWHKLFLDRNIDISREPGCRVMLHATQHSSLIVSQKSTQSLFPGYGLRFIDTPSFRPMNFLHASAKMVRDIGISADQQLLSVASMEPRVKLFDLRTRLVAATFTPSDKALWACAMDRNEREHFLYLGAQHGSTYIYDVRFPETIVDEFKTEGDMSPVISVQPVPAGKTFPNGGFIVCKLQSLWFYEYSTASGTATPTRLSAEGPFISMNFDATYETLLLSARSSARYPQSRYILGKLEKCDDVPIFNVGVSFFGSKTTPVMTRCAQIAVESNTLIAGYIQDVKLLALFDGRREQRLQSMPVQEVVYDTCPVYTTDATYLAALTETKCRIYKLTTTTGAST